jgi:V/A-type H+-transporting ATPase subunit I
LFGLAYGEFFGLEEVGGYKLPALLNRVHDTSTLLVMALAFGVVQVNLGLVLGFMNKLEHGFRAALFEKGSWILLEVGAVLAVTVNQYVGGALAVAAVGMMVKAEGVKGILELPSIVVNILSYARIMAVGLVSVILALVVNQMSGEFFSAGGLGMVLGIGILLAGHAVNLGLGFMSPFIHSMRLHYVEFFMKFYEGGGQKYAPFGKR